MPHLKPVSKVTKVLDRKSSGFTIIELLIATTIFSFIMLIAASGIIRIGQLYYKGVTESRVQEATRTISDELSRSVQFSDGVKVQLVDSPDLQQFCFGDTRYTVNIDKKYVSATGDIGVGSGLVAETLSSGSSCGCPAGCTVEDTRQLLGSNMRILAINVSSIVAGGDDAWQVNLRIAYGDSDLLEHYDNGGTRLTSGPDADINSSTCKSGIPGGSFCAVARLDTAVKKRLN